MNAIKRQSFQGVLKMRTSRRNYTQKMLVRSKSLSGNIVNSPINNLIAAAFKINIANKLFTNFIALHVNTVCLQLLLTADTTLCMIS